MGFSAQMSESRQNHLFLLCAFFLPALILCAYFLTKQIAPFGDSTFLIHDMNAQYVDFYAYMRTVFSGKNSFRYSLSLGLGGDFPSFFVYYLINPLNLIPILLPDRLVPAGISFEMMILFGIVGISCFTALRFFANNRNRIFLLFLSTAYSLSGWMVLNAENFQFLPAAAILPMTVMSLKQARYGEKVWPAAFWLGLSVIMNFYFGYMICIFAVLWMMIPDGSEFRVKNLWVFPAAILISSPVWISAIRQIGDTVKVTDPNWYKPVLSCSPLDLLRKFLPGNFDSRQYRDNGLPSVFCSLTACFCSIGFFFREKEKPKRIHRLTLLLILAASLLFRPLTMIWQGFSQPHWWPYRFSFLFIFMIILCAAESGIRFPAPLLLLAMAGMIYNMDQTFSVKRANAVPASVYVQKISELDDKLSEIPEESNLFRIESLSPRNDNDAIHFAVMGITHFSSLANRNVMDFLKSLGFQQNRYTVRYGYGNTAFSNAFLGVSYVLGQDSVKKLQFPTGIALRLPGKISASEIIAENPLNYQQKLAEILGGAPDLFQAVEPDIMEYVNYACSDEFCWKEDPMKEGFIRFGISSVESENLYAVFYPAPQVGSYQLLLKDQSYSAGGDFFIPLGTGDGTMLQFDLVTEDPVADLPGIMIIREDTRELLELCISLFRGIETEKISSDRLRISFPPAETEWELLITVPYNQRWSVVSGGKRMETDSFLGTFLTVRIPPDISEIELYYR